jgi:hypothetical protein
MKPILIVVSLLAFIGDAAAHHLDNYDARIRAEAQLFAEWFSCKSKNDCALVSVPCRSGLAVNSAHVDDAKEALIRTFPFCLGTSLDDTEAACERRQCVTKPKKDK